MSAPARETLNMRIKPEDRNLFDWAAQSLGKTRTDFILEAARRAAQEALLDRALIQLDPKAYKDFLARLEAPPRANERLRKTMRATPPWK